jgi:aconitate hydratase
MNSFDSKATLRSGDRDYTIYRLPALKARGFNLSRLPFSLKILLENLLRREDGVNVTLGILSFWLIGTQRPSLAGRSPICRRGC